MPPRSAPHRGRRRTALLVGLVLAMLVFGAIARVESSRSAPPATASHAMTNGMTMSDDEMRAAMTRYRALHPAHVTQTTVAPSDSFVAVNFRFEEDGNAATQVDTAKINVGQSIRFKWGTGFHTVTSGDGSLDPNSGAMFNVTMTSAADNFDFQFNGPGTFPFYCTVHEASNMKGVVIVTTPAGTSPEPPPRGGFISPLWPNPTHGDFAANFYQSRAGRARIEIFDTQGRRVAIPVDADLSAGIHPITWNGLRIDGSRPGAGNYFVRLTIPGLRQTRSLVIR